MVSLDVLRIATLTVSRVDAHWFARLTAPGTRDLLDGENSLPD